MFEKKYVPLVFLLAFVFCATGLAAQDSSGVPQEEKTAVYMQVRENLLTAAAAYEGTPYLFAGVSKKGMDCSGLVFCSFQDAFGISVPRTSDAIYSWTTKISREEMQRGDLVFFATTGDPQKVSHVGIYAGDGRFIHSASDGPSTGVIYSSLSESYWARCYFGSGRALPID